MMNPQNNLLGWQDLSEDKTAERPAGEDRGWNAVYKPAPSVGHKPENEALTEWFIQCEVNGVDRLSTCVEIDHQRRGGVPVLKGTNFTVAQLLAELAETSGPDEIAKYFDIDVDAVKDMLNGLSLMVNKPFVR